jgi:2-dehydropantoate 2-reductase
MRLLVVGAGSTGGYYGARLAQAGRNVTFLVRPARAAQLRETGLRITSPLGDITLHPNLVTPGAIAQPYDVVLLTVKGFQLDAALNDLAPAIGPETMILPVLNGMRHMDILAARFGAHTLIGCALRVATELQPDGSIVQLNPNQDLAYGELDGSTTPRIQALDAFFQGVPIGARRSDAIRRELWEKWIQLASLGAITCLMRGPIGAIEASPGGATFALRLLDEVVAIVTAVGTPPAEAFLAATRAAFTAKGSPLASSMYRDLVAGRPIEADTIVGDLVRRAEAAGIDAPLLGASNVHLSVYQNALTVSR